MEVSAALFQNLKKSALNLGKSALTRFIYGFNFSFKMLFQAYLGKKYLKFFPAGPFFRMLQIKCLSKCPYFQKPPLPWKIPRYAPVISCGVWKKIIWYTKKVRIWILMLFEQFYGNYLSRHRSTLPQYPGL